MEMARCVLLVDSTICRPNDGLGNGEVILPSLERFSRTIVPIEGSFGNLSMRSCHSRIYSGCRLRFVLLSKDNFTNILRVKVFPPPLFHTLETLQLGSS